MATGMGDILKYGLLAGGAYLAYRAFQNAPAAAASPAGTAAGAPAAPAAPAAPSYQYTPPTLAQALDNAAKTNSFYVSQGQKMNAWQWAFVWHNGLNKPEIDGGALGSAFFPNGAPADPAQAPTMSAADFVAGLQSKGLAGLGADGAGTRLVPVPVMLATGPGGRRVLNLPATASPAALQAHLRQHSRGRNYLRAGTPMPRGGE